MTPDQGHQGERGLGDQIARYRTAFISVVAMAWRSASLRSPTGNASLARRFSRVYSSADNTTNLVLPLRVTATGCVRASS